MDEQGNIGKMPDLDLIRADMYPLSINDEQTKATIKQVYQDHKLLLEPHGSVGWAGLSRYLQEYGEDDSSPCISFETAHPAKFPQEIRELLAIVPELPPSLQGLDEKEESVVTMDNDYEEFKEYLKKNY